jgi:uncharacterized protein
MDRENFIGKGWSFPPSFSLEKKSVHMVSDEIDIKQSLQILLTTELGERVMRSDFGCDISALLYENTTVTLFTKIRGIIKNAILLYEPRIELIAVYFGSDEAETGVIHIETEYKIRATNTRKNYVFPFYLEEGTHVKK